MHVMERREFRAEAKRLHAEITSGKSIREARKAKPERSPGRGRGGNGRSKRLA
jgi:hypothetical protein